MLLKTKILSLILEEWLIFITTILFVLTTLYLKHIPSYSFAEMEVVFMLFTLFVSVNGLQKSGFILKVATKIDSSKFLALKLVVITFFLSMFVTNDIALVVIVPITLSLNTTKKDILVILEALSANAGSSLTPFGNPQNLFIYWFYDLSPVVFVKTILPFSLSIFLLLILCSIFVKTKKNLDKKFIDYSISQKGYIYFFFIFIVFFCILHILPVWSGGIILLFSAFFDRKALYVDYGLFFIFILFFGIADNLNMILASKLEHSGHIFLFSIFTSQIISNVPATLLFAKFTSNWEALLWGVNVGGFGSIFGSLSNLIAYKIYTKNINFKDMIIFSIKFMLISFLVMIFSIGLYFKT